MGTRGGDSGEAAQKGQHKREYQAGDDMTQGLHVRRAVDNSAGQGVRGVIRSTAQVCLLLI